MTPLIGCIATAPARETVFSKYEGSHGGNMDVNEVTPGRRRPPGRGSRRAGLYFGDCKAAIGDGESCVRLSAARGSSSRLVRSIGRSAMGSPRILPRSYLMTSCRALGQADAAR